MVLRRPATVTVAIYQGSTLVRTIWTGRRLADRDATAGRGTARPRPGRSSSPGTYRVVVEATSSIGASRFSRGVTVKAP